MTRLSGPRVEAPVDLSGAVSAGEGRGSERTSGASLTVGAPSSFAAVL